MPNAATTDMCSSARGAEASTIVERRGDERRQLTASEVFNLNRGRAVEVCVHNTASDVEEVVYIMHVALLSHFSPTLRDKLASDKSLARICTSFDCPKKHAIWVCEWMIAGGKPLGRIPLTWCNADERLEELQTFTWLVLQWDIPGLVNPAARELDAEKMGLRGATMSGDGTRKRSESKNNSHSIVFHSSLVAAHEDSNGY